MELMLHYRWAPSQGFGTHAILEHGQQLLAELRQALPICMKAELNYRSYTLSFSFLAANRHHYDLVCLVEFALLSGRLTIRLGFSQERPLQCRSLHERTVLMRCFMNLNRRCKYHWKVNPNTGEFHCSSTTQLSSFSTLTGEELKEIILEQVYELDRQAQVDLPRILYYAGIKREREGRFFEKEQSFLLQMKTYAVSSPHYAWTILEGFEKNKRDRNRQNIKSHKKNTFLEEMLHNPGIDVLIQKLTRTLSDNEQRDPIELASREQDDRLRDRYLKQVFACQPSSRQMIDIEVDQSVQTNLRHQTVSALPVRGQGQVHVLVERFTRQKRQQLQYELDILKMLPDKEFLGLARYYHISNCNEQLGLRLTALAQTSTLMNYLRSNAQTMSIQNRLNILYQISVNLKYLRDQSIVYHNLTPSTVRINRNLLTKLYDLSNCYLNNDTELSRDVDRFKRIYRNRLPYVINCLDDMQEFETYNEERSDMLSFARVALKVLFGIQPRYYNGSGIIGKVERDNTIRKLQQQMVMAPEKMTGELPLKRILLFVLLESLTNDGSDPTESSNKMNARQSSGEKRHFMNKRPYLDWMVILFKKSMHYYQEASIHL